MDLVLYPTTVLVSKASPREDAFLKNLLNVNVANRYFALKKMGKRACKKCVKNESHTVHKGWNGKVSYYDADRHKFSIGLWPHVKRELQRQRNLRWSVHSARRSIDVMADPHMLDGVTLKEDQTWALGNWLKHGGVGLLWVATSGGKTEVAAAAIKCLFDNGLVKRVLFVVNSLDLLVQARDRLELRLDRAVGIIGGGEYDPTRKVVVAGIQTLHSWIKKDRDEIFGYLRQFDMVVADEAQHQRSRQFRELFKGFKPRYKLGLSASPFRNYNRDFISKMSAGDVAVLDSMGPIVARVSASDLIEEERVARPIVYLYPVNVAPTHSWTAARKAMLASSTVLRVTVRVVRAAAKAEETSLVVAGGSRRLGMKIYNELQIAGVDVYYLHGSIDKDFRNEQRLALINKESQAIVGTTVLDEGVDIPGLRLLVIASGGKSPIQLEQRLGRSLRLKTGKNVAIVVDFVYNSGGDKDYLYKHSLRRIEKYLEEKEFEIRLVKPDEHTRYVRRILKERAVPVDDLPSEKFFRTLGRN